MSKHSYSKSSSDLRGETDLGPPKSRSFLSAIFGHKRSRSADTRNDLKPTYLAPTYPFPPPAYEPPDFKSNDSSSSSKFPSIHMLGKPMRQESRDDALDILHIYDTIPSTAALLNSLQMSTPLFPMDYYEIEKKTTAYIQTLTMEPDPQLRAVTADKLKGFLKQFHSAGRDTKVWVYPLFNNQTVKNANDQLDEIWEEYQTDSIELKELAARQQVGGSLIPLSQEPGEPSRGRPRTRAIPFSRPMAPIPSQSSSGSGSTRPIAPTSSHHSSSRSASVVSRASTASLFQFDYGSDCPDPRAATAHSSRGNIPAQMIPYSQGQPGYPGQGYAGYAQPGQSLPAYSYPPEYYSVSSYPGGACVPQASPSAPMNYGYAQAPGRQPGSQGSYPPGYGSGFYQGSYPSSSR